MMKRLVIVFVFFIALNVAWASDNITDDCIGNVEISSHDFTGSTFSELQNTIDDANESDTIELKNDVSQDGNTSILINKSLTINGNGHTIDAKGKSAIFSIVNQKNARGCSVVLNNITFVNGKSTQGGAIYWNVYNGLVVNSKFINNTATSSGGAIYLRSQSNVSNCVFMNNKASLHGAVYVSAGGCNINNSTFINNTVKTSGGALSIGGNIKMSASTVFNCNFINNTADNSGGAVLWSSSSGTLTDCTFKNNKALKNGGSISWSGANGILNNSTFINNFALEFGGSIYGINTFTLTDSVFTNNTSNKSGGAVYWKMKSGSIYFNNLSFENNTAYSSGGAIHSEANIIITNSLFNHNNLVNTTLDGFTIYSAMTTTVTNSNFTNNTCGGIKIIKATSTVENTTFENNQRAIYLDSGSLALKNNTIKSDNAEIINYNGVINSLLKVNLSSPDLTEKLEININASITDDNGNLVEDKNFNFTIDGVDVPAVYNNETEQYETTYTFKKSGLYNISVNYQNNNINHTVKCINASFTDLNNKILAATDVLTLTYDFAYDGEIDGDFGRGIRINKQLTIDAAGHMINGSDLNRIFMISKNVVLKNMILSNSFNITGGAIHVKNANLTLLNCTFLNNFAQNGGAIYLDSSNLTINTVYFENNIAINDGGAIHAQNSHISINNTSFSNNTCFSAGGAIYQLYSQLIMENTNITNSNALFGPAITSLSSEIFISKSKFKNNNATYYGGALYVMYAPTSYITAEFINNSAYYGGALYLDNTYADVDGSFINNTAKIGGDIYAYKNEGVINNQIDLYQTDLLNLTIYDDGDYPLFKYNPIIYDELPKNYSLRDYGWVSPVKNQLSEGNCWAFTAMAVLESCILKASNITYDFSEENMKNIIALYSKYGWNVLTNDGGNPDMAFGYLLGWLGPVSEEDDEYGKGYLSPLLKSIYHVQNVVYLKRDNYTDNNMIKEAILKYGAVGTNMYYDDRYLNDDVSYYCYRTLKYGNHAVTIVGWDDNYSKNNFQGNPDGDGAWIVKNSWDSDWGDEGYFYVSYYDKMFAPVGDFESSYTFLLNDTIKYDKNYHHTMGKTSFTSFGSENLTYYNTFTINSTEYLTAVSTFFAEPCDYKLEIKINNILKYTHNQSADAGYYTIPLNEFLQLNKGDVLKVIFTVYNFESGVASIPVSDKYMDVDGEVDVTFTNFLDFNNISYLVFNNYEWDLNTEYNCTAVIHAFTIINPIQTHLNLTLNKSEIIAVVSDQYGTILNRGNVTFNINSNSISMPLTNSKAVLEYDFSRYDFYNITATWNSSGYIACVNNTSFESQWDVRLNVLNITYGEDLIINITLGKDKFLNDTVNVEIANYSYIINITKNNTLYKVPDTLNAGEYNITLNYNNQRYSKYSNSTFRIDKYEVNLTCIINNITYNKTQTAGYVEVGGYVNGEFKTFTNYTASLNNGEIIINNSRIYFKNLTGDTYYNLTINLTEQNYNASNTLKIYVKQALTTLSVPEIIFDYGGNSTVTAITDASKIKLISYEDYVTVNGLNITISGLNAGTYYLNFTTDDKNYQTTFANIKVTVNPIQSMLNISDFNYDWDRGCVNISYNNAFNVTANVLNHTEAVINVNDAVINIANLTAGDYVLNVTTVVDENHVSVSKTVKFTVNKLNSTLIIDDFEFNYPNGIVQLNYTGSDKINAFVLNHTEAVINVNNTVINIANLTAGEYVLNVTVVGDVNHLNTSKTVNFKVNKVNATLDNIPDFEFDYNSTATVPITYSGVIEVNAFVLNHSEVIVDINGNVISISNLTTGEYVLNVTVVGDVNHLNISKTTHFTVNKLNSTLIIDDFVFNYPRGMIQVNYTNANNIIASVLNHNEAIININASTISISNLTAGDYVLNVTTVVDENHVSVSKTVKFTVNRLNSTLIIDDFEFNYPNGIVQLNYTGSDKINAFVLNHSEAIVDINGNMISVSNLSAGDYVLNVTVVGDVNHLNISKTVNFKVNKVNATLDNIPDFEFDYNSTATVPINYGGAGKVNAFVLNHSEAIVNISANVISVSNLIAGDYVLNVTVIGDVNHLNISKTVNFTVNKLNSTLNNLTDIEFTYGSAGVILVSFENATNITASVLNNTNAKIIIDKSKILINGLACGEYILNVSTITDNNHIPVSKTCKIKIIPSNSSVKITSLQNITYGQDLILTISVINITELNVQISDLNNNPLHYNALITENNSKVTFKNLNAGEYIITVTNKANVNFTGSKDSVKLKVSKANSDFTIPELINIPYGTSYQIQVTNYSNISAISLNSQIGEYISYKGFAVSISDDLPVGEYILNITGTVNSTNYNEITKTVTVNVSKIQSHIIIKSNESVSYPDCVRIDFEAINTVNMSYIISSRDGEVIYTLNNISDDEISNQFIYLPLLQSGDYRISISSTGNEIYHASNAYADFTVYKNIPNLNVSASYENGVLNIYSNFDGNYSSNMTSDFIMINGTSAIPLSVESGNYKINITYCGDENHYNSSVTCDFKVKTDSSYSLNIPKITPKTIVELPVNLANDATGNVYLTLNGYIIGNYSLVNGSTLISIPQLTSGDYVIGIIYSGDDNYASFNQTQSITVVSLAKISGSDVNSFYLEDALYKIRVLGDDGNPLNGAGVVFKINNQIVATTVTDGMGVASYKITQKPKKYLISATVNGLEITNNLIVKHIIKAKKVTKIKKSKKTTRIKIKLKGHKVFKKKKITIKFKNKKYKIKTNKKGVAKFKITKKMVKKLKKGKKYRFKISYKKDVLTRYVKIVK